MAEFVVGAEPLTCTRLMAAVRSATAFRLSDGTRARVRRARAEVEKILAGDTPVYGVNTGVGSQKDHRVEPAEAALYNRKLVRGHATRVPGPTAEQDVVRATLIVQLHELCSGYSGVSEELVDLIADLTAAPEMPSIDTSGSVGASDLVPLSQLSDWILSQPRAVDLGLPRPKDTLAMINCKRPQPRQRGALHR